ncbi:MAG: MobF family relaxase, partial [Isosphaeraceae bacterium]
MLRIIQSQNATAARHYFDEALAKGDGYYFADRGEREIVGHWFGRDAERLGLAGPVDRDAFHALVEGKDPRSGEPLLQRMRDDRRPGYDFNFHAPKSVSLFYELSRDERIRLAFEQSVRDTMTEIEKDMATRDQSGGKSRKVKTGSMVAAEFTHFTSRPAKEDSRPDPHLHMHVFVMNATHDERRGRWYAPEFHDLHIDRPYHQAAFQKRLASRLQGLGYAVVKTDDAFEIEGVQRATIDKFSRRAREVEDEARRKGITDAKEKDKLGAKTRGGKEKDLTRDELRSYWIGRLDPDEGRDLEAVAARARKGKAAAPEGPTAAQAIDYARDHLFERRSAVSEKALLAEGLRHAVANPAVTPDGLAEEVRRRADFLHGTVKGERWLSTREVFDEEQRMIAFARDGLSSRTPFQRGRLDDAPIEADGKAAELSGEQKKAVRDLVQGSDRVQLLVGKAGTGKTTTLREIQKHVREGGYEFLTFAPSNNARDVLRRDGFGQAETVQKLLASSSLQDAVHRRSLIAVDEAGLLSSRDMARVCALAERKGARLLLIGDSLQHGSVERGDALR